MKGEYIKPRSYVLAADFQSLLAGSLKEGKAPTGNTPPGAGSGGSISDGGVPPPPPGGSTAKGGSLWDTSEDWDSWDAWEE